MKASQRPIPKIPDGMVELMKNLAKSVLKEQPENIYLFAAEYFENLVLERDGSLDKGYSVFRKYEEELERRRDIEGCSRCRRLANAENNNISPKNADDENVSDMSISGVAIKAVPRNYKPIKTQKSRQQLETIQSESLDSAIEDDGKSISTTKSLANDESPKMPMDQVTEEKCSEIESDEIIPTEKIIEPLVEEIIEPISSRKISTDDDILDTPTNETSISDANTDRTIIENVPSNLEIPNDDVLETDLVMEETSEIDKTVIIDSIDGQPIENNVEQLEKASPNTELLCPHKSDRIRTPESDSGLSEKSFNMNIHENEEVATNEKNKNEPVIEEVFVEEKKTILETSAEIKTEESPNTEPQSTGVQDESVDMSNANEVGNNEIEEKQNPSEASVIENKNIEQSVPEPPSDKIQNESVVVSKEPELNETPKLDEKSPPGSESNDVQVELVSDHDSKEHEVSEISNKMDEIKPSSESTEAKGNKLGTETAIEDKSEIAENVELVENVAPVDVKIEQTNSEWVEATEAIAEEVDKKDGNQVKETVAALTDEQIEEKPEEKPVQDEKDNKSDEKIQKSENPTELNVSPDSQNEEQPPIDEQKSAEIKKEEEDSIPVNDTEKNEHNDTKSAEIIETITEKEVKIETIEITEKEIKIETKVQESNQNENPKISSEPLQVDQVEQIKDGSVESSNVKEEIESKQKPEPETAKSDVVPVVESTITESSENNLKNETETIDLEAKSIEKHIEIDTKDANLETKEETIELPEPSDQEPTKETINQDQVSKNENNIEERTEKESKDETDTSGSKPESNEESVEVETPDENKDEIDEKLIESSQIIPQEASNELTKTDDHSAKDLDKEKTTIEMKETNQTEKLVEPTIEKSNIEVMDPENSANISDESVSKFDTTQITIETMQSPEKQSNTEDAIQSSIVQTEENTSNDEQIETSNDPEKTNNEDAASEKSASTKDDLYEKAETEIIGDESVKDLDLFESNQNVEIEKHQIDPIEQQIDSKTIYLDKQNQMQPDSLDIMVDSLENSLEPNVEIDSLADTKSVDSLEVKPQSAKNDATDGQLENEQQNNEKNKIVKQESSVIALPTTNDVSNKTGNLKKSKNSEEMMGDVVDDKGNYDNMNEQMKNELATLNMAAKSLPIHITNIEEVDTPVTPNPIGNESKFKFETEEVNEPKIVTTDEDQATNKTIDDSNKPNLEKGNNENDTENDSKTLSPNNNTIEIKSVTGTADPTSNKVELEIETVTDAKVLSSEKVEILEVGHVDKPANSVHPNETHIEQKLDLEVITEQSDSTNEKNEQIVIEQILTHSDGVKIIEKVMKTVHYLKPMQNISHDTPSSDLSDTDTEKREFISNESCIDENSRDERDDVSEIENFDLSSCGEDSLEAMYYMLRKNEIIMDKVKETTKPKCEDDKIMFPEKATEDLENVFREVSGKKTLCSIGSITNSSTDDVILKQLSSDSDAVQMHVLPNSEIDSSTEPKSCAMNTTDDEQDKAPPIESDLKHNDSETNDEQLDTFVDDLVQANIERKILAYSLSEADSDEMEIRPNTHLMKDDFNVSTTLGHLRSTTEDSDSIESAATKIQAGGRGFLVRRRLGKSDVDKHSSIGNAAIDKSLDNFMERQEGNRDGDSIEISLHTIDQTIESVDIDDDQVQGITEVKMEQKKDPELITKSESGSDNKEVGSDDSSTAQRRLTLQRGDAMQRNSTPDSEQQTETKAKVEKDETPAGTEQTKDGKSTNSEKVKDKQLTSSDQVKDEKPTSDEQIQNEKPTSDEQVKDQKVINIEQTKDKKPTSNEQVKDEAPTDSKQVQEEKSTSNEQVKDEQSTNSDQVKDAKPTSDEYVKDQKPIDIEQTKDKKPVSNEQIKDEAPTVSKQVQDAKPTNNEQINDKVSTSSEQIKNEKSVSGEQAKDQDPTSSEQVKDAIEVKPDSMKPATSASKSNGKLLKLLGPRQRSMPVQIESLLMRILPVHQQKRIKSANNSSPKVNRRPNLF